jgi:hypothetical protein
VVSVAGLIGWLLCQLLVMLSFREM